jgi:hypothetical protein
MSRSNARPLWRQTSSSLSRPRHLHAFHPWSRLLTARRRVWRPAIAEPTAEVLLRACHRGGSRPAESREDRVRALLYGPTTIWSVRDNVPWKRTWRFRRARLNLVRETGVPKGYCTSGRAGDVDSGRYRRLKHGSVAHAIGSCPCYHGHIRASLSRRIPMNIASILFLAYVGYLLGKSDLRVHPALTAVTVVAATILHGWVRLALPHEEIDGIATAIARSWSPGLVAIALVETAGIWIAILAVPWAVLPTRIAASGYIMGAAIQGALAYYQPFDVVILNGRRVPNHPEYEAALVLALVFAAVPFAIGLLTKRRQQRVVPGTLTTMIEPQ